MGEMFDGSRILQRVGLQLAFFVMSAVESLVLETQRP